MGRATQGMVSRRRTGGRVQCPCDWKCLIHSLQIPSEGRTNLALGWNENQADISSVAPVVRMVPSATSGEVPPRLLLMNSLGMDKRVSNRIALQSM